MGKFIRIKSSKFPVLPGEEEELVNEGTYGKALANYLQTKLSERGYTAPFVCCEDWGWWVELEDAPFAFGVCVLGRLADDGSLDLVCTDGASGPRQWSWRKLRFIETDSWVTNLHGDLLSILQSDSDVWVVEVTEDFPL
jgi:hypothetical protein